MFDGRCTFRAIVASLPVNMSLIYVCQFPRRVVIYTFPFTIVTIPEKKKTHHRSRQDRPWERCGFFYLDEGALYHLSHFVCVSLYFDKLIEQQLREVWEKKKTSVWKPPVATLGGLISCIMFFSRYFLRIPQRGKGGSCANWTDRKCSQRGRRR